MGKEHLIAILVSVNFVCFVFLGVMLWLVVSGKFKRFLIRVNNHDIFYSVPRKFVKRALKRGEGYDLAFTFTFKTLMLYDEDFCKAHGGLELFERCELEKELEGKDMEYLWCAVVDLYCNKRAWVKWVKKYPRYIFIESLDFSAAVKRFGGCISQYGKL